jgi:hypothetical protein
MADLVWADSHGSYPICWFNGLQAMDNLRYHRPSPNAMLINTYSSETSSSPVAQVIEALRLHWHATNCGTKGEDLIDRVNLKLFNFISLTAFRIIRLLGWQLNVDVDVDVFFFVDRAGASRSRFGQTSGVSSSVCLVLDNGEGFAGWYVSSCRFDVGMEVKHRFAVFHNIPFFHISSIVTVSEKAYANHYQDIDLVNGLNQSTSRIYIAPGT